jgi:serine phosphatase RsbU (regulator of sigma subunit)
MQCVPRSVDAPEEASARLRYQTLVSLINGLNRVRSIEEAARVVMRDLKYVLRVDAFRLVIADDGGMVTLCGAATAVRVERAITGARPFDDRLLELELPGLLDPEGLPNAAIVPEELLAERLRHVYVHPGKSPDSGATFAFAIGALEPSLNALDFKFAGLVAQLLSDKALKLRADQRSREAEDARRLASLRLEEAYRVLAERDERLRSDLEQARAFQQRLLPELPISSRLTFCAAYAPAEMVGGDIYDVCELGPGRYRLFLADASGHGVQGSLRTMVLKTEYDRLKRAHAGPEALLSALDERISAQYRDLSMRCTAVCVDLDATAPNGVELSYANGGHVPLLVVGPEGTRELYSPGMFLGVQPEVRDRATKDLLRHGERLLLYTDGLVEQRHANGEDFGIRRAETRLKEAVTIDAAVATLLRELAEFARPHGLQDDTTLIGVECGRH